MRVAKQLIPLSYINEACFLSTNIDEKKIKPALEEAQIDLRAALGAEFYEEIETQYAPSGDTFTAANAELYEDYIKKYLAWQAYFYSLGFSQLDSTPTGFRAFKDDNSDLASDVQLFSLEKNAKAKAFKFKSAMIDYLKLQQYRYAQGVSGAYAFAKWTDTCKEEFQFAISAIGREKDEIFAVNKAVTYNE
jgi:hypothetical protein